MTGITGSYDQHHAGVNSIPNGAWQPAIGD